MRRTYRETGRNDDIIGSAANTVKHGISIPEGHKQRVLNPLMPEYQFPGATEVAEDDVFGFKSSTMNKANY